MRSPELEQYKAVWLTERAHRLLRIEKLRQGKEGKSLARLVDDLIIEKYEEKTK